MMRPEDVEPIVTAYGAVLAEPTALGIVRDVRSLPCSKEEVKEALKIALSLTADEGMKESLKVAYISLSDFQQLSDAEIKALQVWNAALSQPNLETSVISSLIAEGEMVTAVKLRIADEAKALVQELRATGV
jgi:hypothetical protein